MIGDEFLNEQKQNYFFSFFQNDLSFLKITRLNIFCHLATILIIVCDEQMPTFFLQSLFTVYTQHKVLQSKIYRVSCTISLPHINKLVCYSNLNVIFSGYQLA